MPYKEGRKWRAKVTINGKRYTCLKETKNEAKEWEVATKKAVLRNERMRREGMDLMTFCTKYLDYAKRFSRKTYDEKTATCRRVLETWGPDRIVQSITEIDADEYLERQEEQRSANAANKDRKNLMAMWNRAKQKRSLRIKYNPFEFTEPFPHDQKRHPCPKLVDVLKVLAVASRKESVFLYSYIYTGARKSEIFRWTLVDDIDLDNGTYRLGTRKTSDQSMDYKTLPMPSELRDQLQWWWDNRTVKESPYVFPNDRQGDDYGKPYRSRQHFMARHCGRANVDKFGFHSLRRLFASLLAKKRKPVKTIQRLLRHANLRTTVLYIDIMDEDLNGVVDDVIDGFLGKEERVISTNR
jgi:integrase